MERIESAKVETPHRVLVDLVMIDSHHWAYCKKTGDYSKRDAEKEAYIASRDAAVRAECAERAAVLLRSLRAEMGLESVISALRLAITQGAESATPTPDPRNAWIKKALPLLKDAKCGIDNAFGKDTKIAMQIEALIAEATK